MLVGFLTAMILIQSIAFCARKRRPAGGSAQEKSPTSANSMKQLSKTTPVEKKSQQKSEDHVFCLPQAKVAEETTNLKSLEDDPVNPLLDPRVRARLMQPPKAPEKTQCPETANVANAIYNVDKQKIGHNDMANNVPREGVIEENKINKTSKPSPLPKCYIVSRMASLSRRKKNEKGREHPAKITKAITPQRKNDAGAPANGELNVEPSSSTGCPSPSVNMDSILVSHCMTVRNSQHPKRSRIVIPSCYAGGIAAMPSKPVAESSLSQQSVLPNVSSNEHLRPASIHVG